MTGLSYMLDDVIPTVPELSGFKTTGLCTQMLELHLIKQSHDCRSHQRHTVDSWRCLDSKTSNDQREPNDLEIGGVFPSVIDPN
jgi:hypothetical protein